VIRIECERMFKRPSSKAAARERSRRTVLMYVEALNDVRTRLKGLFNIR